MKKSWLIVSIAVFYTTVFAISGLCQITHTSPVFYSNNITFPTIIIDPGHGGIDGGAVGADGIIEKDINLSISLYLADLFKLSGYDVMMTRSTDTSIHDEDVTGIKNQKVSDLHNRLKIAKDCPQGIFLSIHQNQFSDSRYSGGQIFYGTKQKNRSSALAEIIQSNFKSMLQPDNNRQTKQAYDSLYLMKNIPSTAVLIECGFLSNPDEAKLLMTAEYQQKLAFVIYSSTLQFIQEEALNNGYKI